MRVNEGSEPSARITITAFVAIEPSPLVILWQPRGERKDNQSA